MKKYEDDTYDYGDHEVTDRAALILELFCEKISEHPKVEADPKLQKLAKKAGDALMAVYQAAAAKMVKPKADWDKHRPVHKKE